MGAPGSPAVDVSVDVDVDALWRAHAPAVVRYARRRVPPAEVDEVVAETFVIAWRRIGEVPDAPLPWLLSVCRGVSANTRRASRRREALEDRFTAAQATDPPPGVVSLGLSGSVADALARLDPDDRELLTLVAWDRLSRQDAAAAIGCSPGTLAVRLHRARRRLRAELEGRPGSQPNTTRSGHTDRAGRPTVPSTTTKESR